MTAASTAAPEGSRLRGAASRRRNEGVIRMVLLAAAVVSILISVGIVLSLVFEAISFISQIDLSQLFAAGWFPRRGKFSIATIVAGTLIITIVAISLAAPSAWPVRSTCPSTRANGFAASSSRSWRSSPASPASSSASSR